MYFYQLSKKSDFQYREQLIELGQFINFINIKTYSRESEITVKYSKIILNFVKKLVYVGVIKNFIIVNKCIRVFFAYDLMGDSVIKYIKLESSLSHIKFLKKFDYYFLKYDRKVYLNLNNINIFFFQENFYTDSEIIDLKKNVRLNNFNKLKVFNICKIYF